MSNVAEFRYLGTNIINQNLIREEIKMRLNSGNPCYHSVQNYNFARGSVWVRNLVSDIKGGTQTEGV
jgi:hypothetical protein